MKSKHLLLLLLLAIGLPWAANAQETLIVCDGTSTSSYAPIKSSGGSQTEFIYPASLLGDMEGGTITSVKFFSSSTSTTNYSNTVTVFVEEVASSTISASAWQYNQSTATKVYEGTTLSVTGGELVITFSTPYEYNGGNLCFNIWSASNTPSVNYYYLATTNSCGYDYYITPPVSVPYSTGSYLPKAEFTYTAASGTCEKPATLEYSNLTSSSVDLTWTGGSGSYEVQYKKASDQEWTVAYYDTYHTTRTINNLEPATNYQARVQSLCEGEEIDPETGDHVFIGSGWKAVSFTTPCDAVTTFPWSEDFESYSYGDFTDPCWVNEHISGNGTQIFKVYTSTNGSNSTHQLQLPDMSNGTMTKLRLPLMTLPTSDNYLFSIDVYRNTSGSSYTSEGVRVFASTDGEIEGATELGFLYRNCGQTDGGVVTAETSTGWYTYEFPIPMTGTCYIVLRGESQYGSATYMDNFKVKKELPCVKPSAPTFVSSTTTSATLSWTNGAEGQTAWQIAYSTNPNFNPDEVTPVDVTSNPGTISGLTASTNYYAYVRANCGDLGYSEWSATYCQFATACDVIPALGYTENFDSYTAGNNVLPTCWNYINTTTYSSYQVYPRVYANGSYSTYANSAPNCLYLYSYYSDWTDYDPQPQYAILPEMTGLAGKQVTLMAKGYNASSTFKIGTMSDPADASTFQQIAEQALTTSYQEFEFVIPANVSGNYLAIMIDAATASRTSNGIYIDDIVIGNVPTCLKPSSPMLETPSSRTAHTATLKWTNGEEGQSAWQIAYSTSATFAPAADFTPGENEWLVDADANPYTLNGLQATTTYYAYVRANCGAEDGVSAWSRTKATFTTTAATAVPTGLAVDASSITSESATVNWTGVATNDYHQSYEVYYSRLNTLPDPLEIDSLITGITATNYTFNHLDAEKTYYVWVRDNCGNDGLSAWSSRASFTTASRCQTPDGLAESNVTTTSAKITWNTYGLTDFNLRYSTDGTTWTTVEHVNSPYTFDNTLTANKAYQVQVQATCADAETWSTVLNFRTECDAITITDSYSWTEDFEAPVTTATYNSSTGLVMPYCWDNYTNSTSGYAYAIPHLLNAGAGTSGYNYSSPASQVLYFYGSGDGYAALPEFTNPLNKLQISFKWASESNANGALTLGYITSEDDGTYNTFTAIGESFAASSASYHQMKSETVYLSEVPATATRLVFRWYYSTWYGANIDDVEVALLPSCYPVGTLAEATDIQATSAKLSWALVDDTQTAWQVCLNGDEDHLVDANTNVNFLLENLSPETAYTVKVRANCGDSQGEWSNEVNFTTLEACPSPSNITITPTQYTADITWNGESDSYNVQYRTAATMGTPIFSEDFSNGIGDWTMVDCHSSTGVSNGTFAFHWNTNPPQYLISPEITGITTDAILEFVYYNNSTTYEETFKVGLSSTDNSTASFSWSETLAVKDNDQHTYHATVPAGTKYMAIQLLSDDKYYLYIDNIVIANAIPAGAWTPTTPISTTEKSCQLTELISGTTYDVQIQGVCNNVLGNWGTASFTTVPYRTFTTEGNWNTASNWTPSGLPGENDDVAIAAAATIPANYTAKVDEITMLDGGSITLDNSSNGSAQLWHNNAGVEATVNVRVFGYNTTSDNKADYQLIASPFAGGFTIEGTSIVDTENEFDLYKFEQNTDLEWLNYELETKPFTTLDNGVGYLYANSKSGWNNFALTGTLQPSNTDKQVTLSYVEGAEFAGWNLVGNPFACNAYAKDATDNIAAYYRMNDAGDGFTTATGAIKPMEGIFVQATTTEQSFNFSRTAPGAKSSQLNMNLRSNNKQLDNAILVFGEGQNLGKFSFRQGSSKVYMPVEGNDYAALFTTEAMGALPVNFKAENNGTYTLSFTNEEVTFSYLHLIDNMTGNDVDLLANPSYSFEARTTDYESRFKLVFATGNNANDDAFAFYSNGSFVINNEGNATLQVIDVNGRILKSESINGCANVNVKAAAGVYMLRLVNGNDVKVQKVVVR